ncbi:MAG: triphosphoribosyl-dephospho-CoA synthase [Mycobacterium sp.]
MTNAVLSPTTTGLTDEAIAESAVYALRAEADLTPKPGLVDRRGAGAHSDMDLAMLHGSAEALRDAFFECASAARHLDVGSDLRDAIGVIGRAGEVQMLEATGGVNTHRGALWALGLLSAGAAAAPGDTAGTIDFAAQLARTPDRRATPARTHGAEVRCRYGATGAAGEAQSGFPHVRLYALPALRAARCSGADEESARLATLLALMAHLDDTCVLHRGGQSGLRALQSGARSVLTAGGVDTPEGGRRFAALDDLCRTRRLSPGGSGDLLSATIFLDAMTEKRCTPCKR